MGYRALGIVVSVLIGSALLYYGGSSNSQTFSYNSNYDSDDYDSYYYLPLSENKRSETSSRSKNNWRRKKPRNTESNAMNVKNGNSQTYSNNNNYNSDPYYALPSFGSSRSETATTSGNNRRRKKPRNTESNAMNVKSENSQTHSYNNNYNSDLYYTLPSSGNSRSETVATSGNNWRRKKPRNTESNAMNVKNGNSQTHSYNNNYNSDPYYTLPSSGSSRSETAATSGNNRRRKKTRNSDSNVDCVICLNKIKGDKFFLSCGHIYHQNCISKWVRTSATCPMCRMLQ